MKLSMSAMAGALLFVIASTIAVLAMVLNNESEALVPQYTNKLAEEKSPYLLQHAHNPVYWYPWCKEAFATAATDNKAIFLSIGYSTCHWCQVMEHESFEVKQVAKLLNDSFIAIKVDREERLDIDMFK